MNEIKLEIHDDNYLETDELFFNINDITLMQYATNPQGTLLIAFCVSGLQIYMPFPDEENRRIMFKEVINRKRALAIGKEALLKYIKQNKKKADA